jgi:hypothetical protein
MTIKQLTILAVALLFAACAQNAHNSPLPQEPKPSKAEGREEVPAGMLGCWSGTLRGKTTWRVTAATAERDQLFRLCFDPAPRCLVQPPEGVAGFHCETKVTSVGPDWVELVSHTAGHDTNDITFLWKADGTGKCRLAGTQLECEGSTSTVGATLRTGAWKVTAEKEVQK